MKAHSMNKRVAVEKQRVHSLSSVSEQLAGITSHNYTVMQMLNDPSKLQTTNYRQTHHSIRMTLNNQRTINASFHM